MTNRILYKHNKIGYLSFQKTNLCFVYEFRIFKKHLVRLERFELPTSSFEDLLSIQLNYRRIKTFGALSQIRTETLRLLRPSSLPIGVRGHLVSSRGNDPLSMAYQAIALPLS